MRKLITTSSFIYLIFWNCLYADVPVKGNIKSDGDVNITGKGDIKVTKTIIQGIPPEEYLKLAKELGVTENAVKNFFKIIKQKEVPKEDWDATLRQIAKRHKELQLRLTYLLVDPEIQKFRKKAEQAIVNGDYDKADKYFDDALDRQMVCINNAEKQLTNCKLSAAEMKADKGNLEVIRFNFKKAVILFKEAVELVPDGYDLKKAEYLINWGDAARYIERYTESQTVLKQCLEIRQRLLPKDDTKIAKTFYKLALSYMEAKDFTNALSYLDNAIKLKNDDTWKFSYFPHREKGVIYYLLGKYELALDELKYSSKTASSQKTIYYLNKVKIKLIKKQNLNFKKYFFPKITLEPEPENVRTITNNPNFILSGNVKGYVEIQKIEIQGEEFLIKELKKNIKFNHKLLLNKGLNEIKIKAVDILKKISIRKILIFLDLAGPEISINKFDSNKIKGNVHDVSGIKALKIDDRIIFDSIKNKNFEFETVVSDDDKYLIAIDLVGNTTKTKLDLTEFGIYLLNYIPKVVYIDRLDLQFDYVRNNKNHLKNIYIANKNVLLKKINFNSKYFSLNETVPLKIGLNFITIRMVYEYGIQHKNTISIERKVPKIFNLKYRAALKIIYNEYKRNPDYEFFTYLFKKFIIKIKRFQICEDNNDYDILCMIEFNDMLDGDTEIKCRFVSKRSKINTVVVHGNKEYKQVLHNLANELAYKVSNFFPIYRGIVISKVNKNQYLIKNDLDLNKSPLALLPYPIILYRDINPESEFGSESIILGQGYITGIRKENNTVLLEFNKDCKIGDKVIGK